MVVAQQALVSVLDLDFNLIGITTFKSPGRRFGNFYCIPVEWVERLLQEEPQIDLVSSGRPFWSLPDEEKPFFMQIIMPMEKKKWQKIIKQNGMNLLLKIK